MSQRGNQQNDRGNHPKPKGPWWKRLLGLGRRPSCNPDRSPEEDVRIAFQASADGDLDHAMFHLASALQADPTDRRMIGLLDRLIAKCQELGRDPLSLAPFNKRGMYAGTGAARAYIAWAIGQYDDAAGLLGAVDEADEDNRWWRWATEWFTDVEKVRSVRPNTVGALLSRGVSSVNGEGSLNAQDKATLESLLPAARVAISAYPDQVMLSWLEVIAVRKLGRLDEAGRLADALWTQHPGYLSGVSVAMVRKMAGDVDGAVQAYENALTYDPEDASIPADLAELLAASGRYEEALEWTERAKARDRKQETSSWALSHLLKHRLDGDEQSLQEYAKCTQPDSGFREVGWKVRERLGPWTSYIPTPTEATINVVRQFIDEKPKGIGNGTLTSQLSHLEAPSAILAATQAMSPVQVITKVDKVPSPDPRKPRGAVEWLLWEYDGTTARPGLPVPASATTEAVVALASQVYGLSEWTAQVKEVMKVLGDNAHFLAADLLAVMVHPPADAPEGMTAWDWIRHVQLAAAILVSHIDGGWENSLRRLALIALLRGPVDWTTEAGIVALAQVYKETNQSDSARREMIELFKELSDNLPDAGGCCYDHTLAWALNSIHPFAPIEPRDFARLWERLRSD